MSHAHPPPPAAASSPACPCWPLRRSSLPAAATTRAGAKASSSGGASAGNGEEAAFPATITHKYGETTVEAAPKRVVCVGLTDQDTLMALGIVPVGVTYWFGDEELRASTRGRRSASATPSCPRVLKDTDGVQIEKIAALRARPDHRPVRRAHRAGVRASSPRWRPVVAQSGDYADYGMPWDEMALDDRHRRRPAAGRPGR